MSSTISATLLTLCHIKFNSINLNKVAWKERLICDSRVIISVWIQVYHKYNLMTNVVTWQIILQSQFYIILCDYDVVPDWVLIEYTESVKNTIRKSRLTTLIRNKWTDSKLTFKILYFICCCLYYSLGFIVDLLFKKTKKWLVLSDAFIYWFLSFLRH